MKRIATWVFIAIIGCFCSSTRAALIVDATIDAKLNGGAYDYSIVLHNSAASTVNVGTFWFAWIPGQDYLTTSPSAVTSPAGWTGVITHVPNVPTNGFAIQWVAGSSSAFNPALAIAPGGSLTFGIRSVDTPEQVYGNSIFFDHPPVLTSFVYERNPFQGEALQFVVTATPEPSSLTLAGVGAVLGALGLRRAAARRRPARA